MSLALQVENVEQSEVQYMTSGILTDNKHIVHFEANQLSHFNMQTGDKGNQNSLNAQR